MPLVQQAVNTCSFCKRIVQLTRTKQWLRKSYSKTFIGKVVLNLPESLQEPAFMLIQYSYAVATMLPCPIWFYYRYASATFLMALFCWSVYNGATFYIDVFGKRFQKELEALQQEVQKYQSSPGGTSTSPMLTPRTEGSAEIDQEKVDKIPLLSEQIGSTGIDGGAGVVATERKIGDLPAWRGHYGRWREKFNLCMIGGYGMGEVTFQFPVRIFVMLVRIDERGILINETRRWLSFGIWFLCSGGYTTQASRKIFSIWFRLSDIVSSFFQLAEINRMKEDISLLYKTSKVCTLSFLEWRIVTNPSPGPSHPTIEL